MNDPVHATVWQRQLDLGFEELGGRACPPDRTAAILRRIGERPRPWWLAPHTLAAAATMLLGIGVTVAVALSNSTPSETSRGFGIAPTPADSVTAAGPVTGQATPGVTAPGTNGTTPHPKGTDPADLAAARSAEAMLAAERRLATLRADGKLPGGREPLDFATLRDWTYTNGLAGMPEAVQALDGTPVVMVGFMLPTDAVEDMQEFLLVESLWSCCYGTPPDIHGIVRCVMQAGATADHSYDPVLISGTLTIGPTIEDGYVVDIFQLRVDAILPL